MRRGELTSLSVWSVVGGIEIVPIADHPLTVVTASFASSSSQEDVVWYGAKKRHDAKSARRARLEAEMATGGNAAGLDMC